MADSYYTIPLSAEPQSFGITLAGKEYRLTVRWMEVSDGDAARTNESGWLLDIQRPENAAPLLMGLPLVTGCDLLEPFAYLNFGGELWIDAELPASREGLGTETELIFVVRGAA